VSSRPDDAGRRGQIVRESARLFREKGYEATSVRDIAAATGLQSGSWVYHFRTKQDILAAVMEEGLKQALERIEAIGRAQLAPRVVVDGIMAKRNTGTHITDAPFVLALGPGFTPGVDCHAAIETRRGHNLGRVLWDRAAESNTGVPGEIGGKGAERVLRAPCDGTLKQRLEIGDWVARGDVIARVASADVLAPFDGILRGLVHEGLVVQAGTKIGDVDPRAQREHCFTIGDKARAVGGSALEAILTWMATHRK